MKQKDSTAISVNDIIFWLDKSDLKKYKIMSEKLSRNNRHIKVLLDGSFIIRSSEGNISAKEKNRIYKLDKALSKSKTLISKLMRIHIYLELKALGKVESLINSILEKEFVEDFFYSDHLYKLNDQIASQLILILNNVSENFDDKKLFDVLLAHLSYGVDQKLRSKIVAQFDIPNKLSDVQSRIRSVNYAFKYPFVWAPWIEKYSSRIELQNYIEKTSISSLLTRNKHKYIVAMRSSLTKDKDKRELMLESYKDLKKSTDPYLKDVMFRSHLNESFVKLLIKESMAGKPIFIEMKKFYRKQIQLNENLSYSLYNLLKLGDIQKGQHIIALALKNNGL